jgi:hypothetical protein
VLPIRHGKLQVGGEFYQLLVFKELLYQVIKGVFFFGEKKKELKKEVHLQSSAVIAFSLIVS